MSEGYGTYIYALRSPKLARVCEVYNERGAKETVAVASLSFVYCSMVPKTYNHDITFNRLGKLWEEYEGQRPKYASFTWNKNGHHIRKFNQVMYFEDLVEFPLRWEDRNRDFKVLGRVGSILKPLYE